jgi:hypothetical protein
MLAGIFNPTMVCLLTIDIEIARKHPAGILSTDNMSTETLRRNLVSRPFNL